jgi:hypothetical protein
VKTKVGHNQVPIAWYCFGVLPLSNYLKIVQQKWFQHILLFFFFMGRVMQKYDVDGLAV